MTSVRASDAHECRIMVTSAQNRSGVLEIDPKGHGYLRDSRRDFRVAPDDAFVDQALVGRYRLRQGLRIDGPVEPGPDGRGHRLSAVATIEGTDPGTHVDGPEFESLTAIDPTRALRLETGNEPLGTRVIDLFTPVGMGQRGLIVAPPRSGKTILLRQIADAIASNHPEVALMVLLVDERPEEVTELRRAIRGDVLASSNDREAEEHIRLASLAFDRARRIAERGGDVVLLVDSLTRLARAVNKGTSTGRTMSGGVDVKALDLPKKLFGAARAFDEGGSITVLATCLVETGSRMDEVIFQEFKGTGNMELVLDRRLAERRVWPAIDLAQSGTRKEERLLAPETLRLVGLLRRTLADLKPVEAMESLVRQLAKFPDNAAFLGRLGQAGRSA